MSKNSSNANNSANAGISYVNSNNAVSNTNANYRSHKIYHVSFPTLPLGKR